MRKVKEVLDKLHDIGLSHNDARLPNICFNTNFEVILIDYNRYVPLYRSYFMFSRESTCSCIYDIPDVLRLIENHGKFRYDAIGLVNGRCLHNSVRPT